MANTVLPLSSDIYLEVDGKKVAVVQSYTTRATRTSREIEAFGKTSRWRRSRARTSTRWS